MFLLGCKDARGSLMADGSGDEFSPPSVPTDGGLFGVTDESGLEQLVASSSGRFDVGDSNTHGREQAVVPSHVNFDYAVGSSWNALQTSVTEPVWNSGFWKCIFGNETLGANLDQNFKRPFPVAGGLSSASLDDTDFESQKKLRMVKDTSSSAPLFKNCVKSADDISWQEQREAHLQRALKHWLVLVMDWQDSVDFVQCVAGCDSVNSQLIMLGDVFRGKAPSTLSKRANSMKILGQQLDYIGLKFPCSEPTLYGILCELRRQGAPASRSKGILEAIAFVRYTMGVVECDPLLRGKRCWGASTSDAPLQRNQASPLLVKELEKLHNILENSADMWDKMFSGMVLFVTYSRARWSDAQHASSIFFDEDEGQVKFVEAVTGLHKTMRALQHRHQFLPLVAPALGVTNQNWGFAWKKVREDLGIDLEQGFALMPAPLENGSPGKRPLDSQEAGRWLRGLLEISDSSLPVRKVSSHSLKSTLLSYLAKRGIDMSDRLLLGYHTSPFTMGLTYSRDGMARPLQILGNMLEEIRNGIYFPDSTRSGRLAKPGVEPSRDADGSQVVEQSIKIEISDDEGELDAWQLLGAKSQSESLPQVIPESCEDEMNDACTETSSSDVSESEENQSNFEKSGHRTFEPPVAPDGFVMWQHVKSKILHLADYRFPSVFECGRKPGPFHTKDGLRPRWDTGICWRCFKHR